MNITLNEKIIRDFGRASKDYDNYAVLQRQVADRLFAMVKSQFGDGVVLDIGCGTGYFHELLRKNKIYLPLVQMDISPRMCEVSASYASPPEYGGTYTCVSDMHFLPFKDNAFSVLFSSMTMQWATDVKQVFQEAARVLKPGGKFAFSIVGNGSLKELNEVFKTSGQVPPIHKFYSETEIIMQIANCGFNGYKVSSENITMYYDDIFGLLGAIKGVGASYKGVRGVGIKGKNYFLDIDALYKNTFFSEKGLLASWNIIYITGGR